MALKILQEAKGSTSSLEQQSWQAFQTPGSSQCTKAHRLPLRIMEKEVFNKLSTKTTVSAATIGRFLANSTENLSHQPKTQCLQGLELRPQVSFLLGSCSTTTLNLWQIWARYGCTCLSTGGLPGGWSLPGLHSIMSQKTTSLCANISLLLLYAPLTLTEFHAIEDSYNSTMARTAFSSWSSCLHLKCVSLLSD